MTGKISPVFLFVSILIALICGRAEAAAPNNIPRGTGDIYVQDAAGLLNQNEEAQLNQLGRTVEDRTTSQIAVLTVKSIGDESIEDFALKAYRSYGLGTQKKDNGALLVLALKEKKIRIEVGYGLEGVIPDGRAGRIIDEYAIPSLKAGQPNLAVMKTYGALANAASAGGDQTDKPEQDSGTSIPSWILVLIVVGIIIIDFTFFGGTLTFLLLSIFSRGGGGGPRRGGGGSSGGGGASRGW